ncbi:MAG: Cytochrome c oxidase subunit 5A [Phylliscum demangeonii]|nr:MAG: Cytochrome c oxidase subunit 5A [Phylliscum demangeonii]
MLRSTMLRTSISSRTSLFCARRTHVVRLSTGLSAETSPTPEATPRAHAHAISNPTLANIEKRWETMRPEEQADLWMALRDRMKVDWHELTWQEKKAGYWVAFGPHGPRAVPPPGEGWRVFWGTMAGLGISVIIFVAIRMFAKPLPRTMTREWQEATNEYLKEQKVEPITGFASEGYKGRGMIQSPPEKKK